MKKIVLVTFLTIVGCGDPEPAADIAEVKQAVAVDCANPLPGWADCGGDTQVYDGEFLMFSQINFGGCCHWTHPNPTQTNASLQTWIGNIFSWKSNLHKTSYAWSMGSCYPAQETVIPIGHNEVSFALLWGDWWPACKVPVSMQLKN